MTRPHFTHAQRAALPEPRPRAVRAARYEARAVWDLGNFCQSQPLQHFDAHPLYLRSPDTFAVYEIGGFYITDAEYRNRAAAETHAAQLNGAA